MPFRKKRRPAYRQENVRDARSAAGRLGAPPQHPVPPQPPQGYAPDTVYPDQQLLPDSLVAEFDEIRTEILNNTSRTNKQIAALTASVEKMRASQIDAIKARVGLRDFPTTGELDNHEERLNGILEQIKIAEKTGTPEDIGKQCDEFYKLYDKKLERKALTLATQLIPRLDNARENYVQLVDGSSKYMCLLRESYLKVLNSEEMATETVNKIAEGVGKEIEAKVKDVLDFFKDEQKIMTADKQAFIKKQERLSEQLEEVEEKIDDQLAGRQPKKAGKHLRAKYLDDEDKKEKIKEELKEELKQFRRGRGRPKKEEVEEDEEPEEEFEEEEYEEEK